MAGWSSRRWITRRRSRPPNRPGSAPSPFSRANAGAIWPRKNPAVARRVDWHHAGGIASGGFFLQIVIVAFEIGISRVDLGALGRTTRRLGELALDLLQRFGLGHVVDDRDLTGHAVNRSLVKLTLGIRLLGLRLGAVEIADDL